MTLTKALAAFSAGALLLIGQSAAAQDERSDRAQDRDPQVQTGQDRIHGETAAEARMRTGEPPTQADEFARTDDDDPMADDPMVAEEDDPFFTEDDDPLVAEEDDPLVTEERERTARDVRTTETDVHTETRTDAGTDTRVTGGTTRLHTHDKVVSVVPCPCPPAAQATAEVDVDEQRLETLVRIHRDMQALQHQEPIHDAQQHNELVERQIEVIERHGWTRDEYNQVVQQVNTDETLETELRQKIEEEQVAGEFDDDDEWETTAFEDDDADDRGDETVADLEDDRDW